MLRGKADRLVPEARDVEGKQASVLVAEGGEEEEEGAGGNKYNIYPFSLLFNTHINFDSVTLVPVLNITSPIRVYHHCISRGPRKAYMQVPAVTCSMCAYYYVGPTSLD